ncbi:hypothetical protein [Shewanella psychrophila]|uniref:hypothetical protein n=1 Tax=Shewanella psychrophila TaxID=225848 RepID=UPI00098B5B6C|nr:hypothetical protein [Shewanella psychrophila]
MKNYTAEEILVLSRAEKEPRLLAVALFLEGHSRTDVAERLKVARGSVAKYLVSGPRGLDAKLSHLKPKAATKYIYRRTKYEFPLRQTDR